jgi:hypothetical protein
VYQYTGESAALVPAVRKESICIEHAPTVNGIPLHVGVHVATCVTSDEDRLRHDRRGSPASRLTRLACVMVDEDRLRHV